MTPAADWDHTLSDLQRRRDRSLQMGGPERLAAHRAKGELDARARIERLVDAGSFRELGTLVEARSPPTESSSAPAMSTVRR